MNATRGFLLSICISAVLVASPVPFSTRTAAQTADKSNGLVGAWTLNKDNSDKPTAPDTNGDGRTGGGRRGGGGFGRRGGGGFGGGGRRGGGATATDPEAAARLRDAMRDVMNPPDHLIIVATDTTIVMTGPDGRTTRLSPDGKKVKDQNTNIERKTKWDGMKLVSEITGLGPGKFVESYWVDAERHQLHVSTDVSRNGQTRTVLHVYDPDPR